MADKANKWGTAIRPGKQDGSQFNMLVSPLGEDCVENPTYSPAHTVEGAKMRRSGPKPSQPEQQRAVRRGEQR